MPDRCFRMLICAPSEQVNQSISWNDTDCFIMVKSICTQKILK